MSRDQRLLMALHGEATAWERLSSGLELAVSPEARRSRRRYAAISALLRSALAEDEPIVIRVGRPKVADRKTVTSWALLGLLLLAIFFEYRGYTVPALQEWWVIALHRCGL